MRRELAKGDLSALVLAVLTTGPRHGYSIAREVERLSDDALHMHEGTLYPALRVLETEGLIIGAWVPQEKGADRKVYTLTDAGTKATQKRTQELHDYTNSLQKILARTGHAQPA